MKKRMGILRTISLIVVTLICARNLWQGFTKNTQMTDVPAYLAATYPGEDLKVTATHYGGDGAYAIVRPGNEPDALFRVFYDKNLTPYPYYDTYYSLKLRAPARAAVEDALASVLPQAKVLIKIWSLDKETISTTPTLDEFLSKKSGSIGMYLAFPPSEAGAFTTQNMEAALNALASAGLKGPVTFGLLKEGQSGLTDVDVENKFSKWCQQTRSGRVKDDWTTTLK
ncbi:MAG: hypothetical protein IKK34_04630 [Clostridia bacterium]|nr:hypothetical protein [Clostridia bacterium]